MRRRVRLTESDLHRIVRGTVKRVLNEEIDTGQVPSASERRRSKSPDSPKIREIEKKIRQLRRMIGEYDDEGKDISGLQKQIEKLKKEAGFTTESRIRGIVKRVLREWADGTDTKQAYHIASIGDTEDQESADAAYEIYDALTHNQMTAEEAIQEITNGDMSADGDVEVVPRSAHNFGSSSDGRYFLTYDQYTGAFDVWEKA